MLKILELREKAKAEQGDRSNIRRFHDTILGGGALPLEILERRVHGWVTEAGAARGAGLWPCASINRP